VLEKLSEAQNNTDETKRDQIFLSIDKHLDRLGKMNEVSTQI